MADGVFNIAKGRVAELANRVNSNDPTNAVFHIELAFGAATDATIKDYDDLSALLGDAGVTVATFTNYAEKTVADGAGLTVTTDDTNDRVDVDMNDLTWSAAGNGTNNTLTRMFICYDSDSTGGTDANIVPMTYYDFSATTDGSDLIAQFHTQGIFSAT